MTLSTDQLALRLTGLGASDIGKLIDGKQFDVWLQKTDPVQYAELHPQSEEMSLGHRLEPFVASWCADEFRLPLALDGKTVKGPEPWMLATPDYVTIPEGDPFEIKAWAYDFKDDGCPMSVEAQVRWQMRVLGRPKGYAGCWNRMSAAPPVLFPFEKDQETDGYLLEIAEHFWRRYVIPKKEPPLGGEGSEYSRYLDRLRPKRPGFKATRESHPDLFRRIDQYRQAHAALKEPEQAKSTAFLELKSMLRDVEWVDLGPEGKIHYKVYPGKPETDWEATARRFMGMICAPDGGGKAEDLAPKPAMVKTCAEIIAQETRTTPYRKMMPKLKGISTDAEP